MTVETLAIFEVKNYKEAFKLYKKGMFGLTEQRMPDNLAPLKKCDGSNYKRILSLLEEDSDNLYNVLKTKKGFKIVVLGLSIHKELEGDVSAYYLNYGEDGKWEEVVYKEDLDENPVYSDGSDGKLSIGQKVELKHKTKDNLHDILKGKSVYVKNGIQLEEVRDAFELIGLKVKYSYKEEDYLNESANVGFLYEEGERLILAKTLPVKGIKVISIEDFMKTLT